VLLETKTAGRSAVQQPQHYLAEFERFERTASGHPVLQRLRNAAIARLAEIGLPGPRDEEWRFTNVAPLAAIPFALAAEAPPLPKVPAGAVICTLLEALKRYPNLVEPHLARHADYKSHAFVALNTAFLRDGLFVNIPKGVTVDQPIELRFAPKAADATTAPPVHYRRNLVVLAEGSRATLAEQFTGPEQAHFTNAVTEIVLGAGAALDHYKVQREESGAFHFHALQVRQERGTNFASHSITLGGRWTRNDVNAVLGDEGCECTLNGLYMVGGDRLVDNHTRIDHARPRCASHELYKGILDGSAHGVFNGKIFVHKDAQKTDAKQTNKTLLLSDDAVIDTKPQLEIYADDVKCTHGASIGQLDEEGLYYLRSRGIDAASARRLLTFAFANDIIERVKIEALRDELQRAIAGGV